MRTLWTALRHPIAVRRLSRIMGETMRREAIRTAHEHREYEAAVRAKDLERDLATYLAATKAETYQPTPHVCQVCDQPLTAPHAPDCARAAYAEVCTRQDLTR